METDTPRVRKRSLAIIGNEPEALVLAVLLSEAGVPSYLVGPFEGLDDRNPSNAWDEARWLLNLQKRKEIIIQQSDLEDLPLSEVQDFILTGHATDLQGTSRIEGTIRTISKTLQRGTSLVFAGLCRPGFTLGTIGQLISKYSGMSVGNEVGLCYLPILWNGEGMTTFREKPIIMGASDEKTAYHTQELLLQVFPTLTTTEKIPTAEAAGLFVPIQREVARALELELASLCQNEHVDYADAAELCKASGMLNLRAPRTAASRDFLASTVALSSPRLGKCRVIRAARGVNEHAGAQVLALIKNSLALCGRRIRHSKIAVLGLAGLHSMPEIDPVQPQILQTLKRRGATISLYADDSSPKVSLGREITLEKSISRAVQRANCAVIALDKRFEAELDPQSLASEMARPAAVCDLNRILEASNVERAGLFYTSIGRGFSEV